jgi:phosphate transport system protein
MRTTFHRELTTLSLGLADMCGAAGEAMRRATTALLEADSRAAEQVISAQDHLQLLKTQTEASALRLLALQAPVASELRSVVGTLQSVADADRMGGLALHVAKIVCLRSPGHAVPDDVRAHFGQMGSIAVDLGTTAQEVVRSADRGRAAQMSDDDKAMDALHRHLFTVVLDHEWQHGVAAAVDVTLLGRFYERFADHAVEIGRRVVFQVTGVAAHAG